MSNNYNRKNFSNEDDFYYEGKDLEAMSFAPNYHKWILRHFSPFMGQKILEVGSGKGSISELILQTFPRIEKLFLLEPSEMLEQSQRKLDKYQKKVDFRKNFLKSEIDYYQQQNLDTIIYINVLEHIADDQQELQIANHILNPRGHILTFSPALPALYGAFDEAIGHYRRYYLKDMKRNLQKAGFQLVTAYYFDFLGMILWWIKYKLLKHNNLGGNTVSLFDRFVVPLENLLEPSPLLPLGKNILVVGQKPR